MLLLHLHGLKTKPNIGFGLVPETKLVLRYNQFGYRSEPARNWFEIGLS